MATRLVVKLFEHVNYGGQYRYLYEDVPSFSQHGFNDKVSSVIIYKGNGYFQGDKVKLYEHDNFQGRSIELAPGYYPNIHEAPYLFPDMMSSADFFPVDPVPSASPIRLIIKVYEHINYGGQERTIIYSEPNISNLGFNDTISSFKVLAGPDYTGEVVSFYEHINFSGGVLQPERFGAGTSVPNIAVFPYNFNDRISSVKIFKP